MTIRKLTVRVGLGGLLCALATVAAHGQAVNQVKPRVLLMVDTSGSMTQHMIDNNDTGSDQSTSYFDPVIGLRGPAQAPYNLYPGYATGPTACSATPTYDPNTSRMFNAKQAVTNVINGSGNIDWGLMRYNGTYCAFDNTSVADTSVGNFTSTSAQTTAWPNSNQNATAGANPNPATCTMDSQCIRSNRCIINGGGAGVGRCACSANSQCASGRCNLATGECICRANGDCAGSNSCDTTTGQCRCTADNQCSSGHCNTTTQQCACTASNQCPSGACNTTTGQCGCSTDNQCLGNIGNNAGNNSVSGSCLNGTCACRAAGGGLNLGSACLSHTCNPNSGFCSCSNGNQCASGSCNANRTCNCTATTGCPSSGQTCNTTTGSCGCGNDWQCGNDEFCVNSVCVTDNNLCNQDSYGGSNARNGGTCNRAKNLPETYAGGCGNNGGALSAVCGTAQVCYADSDCTPGNAGQCKLDSSGLWGTCSCGTGGNSCPAPGGAADYSCSNNTCTYNQDCIDTSGGVILVDPVAAQSQSVLQWADGVEDFEDAGGGVIKNPELRAVGTTPLGGAARAATAWYNGIADPQKACRPYVLVQITDGFDTCEPGDQAEGPAAAASGFVTATVPGALNPNKVYVIGLAFGTTPSPTLNKIAAAGGTGQARLANSEQEIESALADIVASSVLVEKCNGKDDNCNQLCDENFPGVAVTNPGSDGKICLNPHSAAGCDNGWPQGTRCFFGGHDVCSLDQLSQTCSAVSCAATITGTLSSPATNVMRVTGVSNIPATAVGQLLYVNGSAQASNNGAFVIVAVNVAGNTVDVSNAGFVADATAVAWGYTSLQGAPTSITIPANGTVRLTVPANALDKTVGANNGVNVGDTVFVVGAAPALLNGSFTVSAVTSTGAGPYTIDLTNSAAIAGTTVTSVGQWLDPGHCPNVEVCNGLDDDCNGIVDDCTNGASGSCCKKSCPPCAKPPFVETCNNCDDDCDGTIDNNLVDTGAACGTNVGDCAPGQVVCCSNASPTVANCTRDGMNDKLSCAGGNPGYPVSGPDLCDGTDDNCNGVPNDTPPRQCFTTPAGGPLTGSPTCNDMVPPGQCGCHYGTQQCVQPVVANSGPGGVCPGPMSWPPNKPCPNTNPATQWGACADAQGGSPEICNGIDDDCDGIIDNNLTDPWVNPNDPSHRCCTPGGNCNNTGGSMACAFGGYVCQSGSKVCVGAIPQTPEICDGLDNDCNGIIDDVPGVGNLCTGPGIISGGACRAVLQCVQGNAAPQCVQTVFPMPEVCNGIDDNCNNEIDDTDPPLAPANGMLPGTGVACDVPMPPLNHPPCKPGVTVCVAGMIVCEGAVGPMKNQCNGISVDCTGQPNTNGDCPTGFQCYQGNCVQPCSGGEFPCAGGYVCNKGTNACDMPNQHTGCCVPDACAKINCPTGDVCMVDDQGNAQCIDPCKHINCGAGYICKGGACQDASCHTQGCPVGQLCKGSPPACVGDPCAHVTCNGFEYCDNGRCVAACSGPCPTGENCDDGKCVPDPCAKVNCLENQVCAVVNGAGMCVDNQCVEGCNPGDVCCGGSCVTDPCIDIHCPEDTHCTVLSSCSATCNTNPAPPRDQVVGAGGGGWGCAVASPHEGQGSSLAWLLGGMLLLLWRRRRGATEVR
jgi:hypothetical protein